MHALILSSRREDNPYGDTDETYIFPTTYLPRFEPLNRGEPILALVYEPRRGGGRLQYVAWGLLTTPPALRPDGYWEVRYDGRLVPLPRPVPLTAADGSAFESRLRVTERQRWGSVLQGQSVRTIEVFEAQSILAYAGLIAELDSASDPLISPTDRAEEVVWRSVRERGFRGQVLSAYAFRCAVTGFGGPPQEARSVLDAAHLRPVAQAGADHVRNGLSLAPGVHRLYDGGLIGFGYVGGHLELAVSPALETVTFDGPAGRLQFENGQRLLLPIDRRTWPDPDALDWHRARVFRG